MARFDFFISYSNEDRRWAEWLAYRLEGLGYRVVLDGWQIEPGEAYAGKISDLIEASGTFIALISKKYLSSQHTQVEWLSVVLNGPITSPRIIPVRIADVPVPPLLRDFYSLDLVGLSERQAEARIASLADKPNRRERPTTPPLFPGNANDVLAEAKKQTNARIFISYSHKDVDWLDRIRVFLKPLERQGSIDLWSDERIQAGQLWREEIAQALQSSNIALLLISSDFLASDFINSEELPTILRQAKNQTTSIYSIVVRPSRFERSPLSNFQALNPSSVPLSGLVRHKREELLVKIVNIIEDSCE